MRSHFVALRRARAVPAIILTAAVTLSAGLAAAQPVLSPLVFSGGRKIFVDDDGVPGPTAGDGNWTAFSDGVTLLLRGSQGSSSAAVRALSGDFEFDIVTFNASTANLQMTDAPGVTPPIPSSKNVTAAATGSGTVFRSVALTQGGGSIGGGQLCSSAGSPAAEVILANGMGIVAGLSVITQLPSSNEYLKVPSIPFEEGPNGQSTGYHDVYVPVESDNAGKVVTIADSNNANAPVASIRLTGLPPCSVVPPESTPTTTTTGLAVILLALTALGARVLRRPAFRQALPGF